MFWIVIFLILVALLVGWATPQPKIAARFTDWVVVKWGLAISKIRNR